MGSTLPADFPRRDPDTAAAAASKDSGNMVDMLGRCSVGVVGRKTAWPWRWIFVSSFCLLTLCVPVS